MSAFSPALHQHLTRVGDNTSMRPFTVSENALKLQPVEPDPFIATSIGGSPGTRVRASRTHATSPSARRRASTPPAETTTHRQPLHQICP
jgi:hypothetical protein